MAALFLHEFQYCFFSLLHFCHLPLFFLVVLENVKISVLVGASGDYQLTDDITVTKMYLLLVFS